MGVHERGGMLLTMRVFSGTFLFPPPLSLSASTVLKPAGQCVAGGMSGAGMSLTDWTQ